MNDIDWLDDTVFASAGNDSQLYICRTDDMRPHYKLEGHTDDVTLIRWSPIHHKPDGSLARPRGKYLASVADDGRLIIWEMDKYPLQRSGSSTRSSAPSRSGSVSPMKHDAGEDYDFDTPDGGGGSKKEKMGKNVVVEWLVVDKSKDKRMVALEWSPEYNEKRMLIAA